MRVQIPAKAKLAPLLNPYQTYVGFVAAAVSKPMGGCRARRSLVVDVDVSVATELTVL